MYQTHNYVFSHTKTCYLKHSIKHIVCFMNIVNTYFYNIFLNHNFLIILNNDTKNLQPNGRVSFQYLLLAASVGHYEGKDRIHASNLPE